MLDATLVLRQMESAGTRLNLVILDACRNNPFGGRGLRASGGGLAQMQAPEGTLISYATQPGNVAQDGADGDSPYTKALAVTMRTPGLDIFQTFNEVGLQAKRATGRLAAALGGKLSDRGHFLLCRSAGNCNRRTSALAAGGVRNRTQARATAGGCAGRGTATTLRHRQHDYLRKLSAALGAWQSLWP